jgi:hypothetical protein
VIFWRNIISTLPPNINNNFIFINDDDDDHRFDSDDGGENYMNDGNGNGNGSNNNNNNWGSNPRYVFLSSNVLIYARRVARHNTGNWPQMHMRRLRRTASLASLVSFLFSSTTFYSTNDYIQTYMEPCRHDGLVRCRNDGPTAATKAAMATRGTTWTRGTKEETSDRAWRCHYRDFFSLLTLRTLMVFL